MKWIRVMRYQSSRELICRTDDIDYIVMRECDHTADIYLKNGHQFTVESSGLWDHLVPVNEKTVLNSLYGMSVARPLPDYDPEILRSEIQDLKLENDRLKQRNELMEDYIHAIACNTSKKSKFYGLCDNVSCPYYDHDKGVFHGVCQLGSRDLIEQEAADIIEELEVL